MYVESYTTYPTTTLQFVQRDQRVQRVPHALHVLVDNVHEGGGDHPAPTDDHQSQDGGHSCSLITGRGLVLFVSIGGWFETATSFKTVFLESSILTPVPLWRVSALDFLVTGISLLRRYQVRNILEDGPKFWPSRDSDFCKKSDAYPDGSHMLQDPRHHRNM